MKTKEKLFQWLEKNTAGLDMKSKKNKNLAIFSYNDILELIEEFNKEFEKSWRKVKK